MLFAGLGMKLVLEMFNGKANRNDTDLKYCLLLSRGSTAEVTTTNGEKYKGRFAAFSGELEILLESAYLVTNDSEGSTSEKNFDVLVIKADKVLSMKCVKIIPADALEESENPTGMHENGSGDSVGEEAMPSKSFRIVHLDLTPLPASEKLNTGKDDLELTADKFDLDSSVNLDQKTGVTKSEKNNLGHDRVNEKTTIDGDDLKRIAEDEIDAKMNQCSTVESPVSLSLPQDTKTELHETGDHPPSDAGRCTPRVLTIDDYVVDYALTEALSALLGLVKTTQFGNKKRYSGTSRYYNRLPKYYYPRTFYALPKMKLSLNPNAEEFIPRTITSNKLEPNGDSGAPNPVSMEQPLPMLKETPAPVVQVPSPMLEEQTVPVVKSQSTPALEDKPTVGVQNQQTQELKKDESAPAVLRQPIQIVEEQAALVIQHLPTPSPVFQQQPAPPLCMPPSMESIMCVPHYQLFPPPPNLAPNPFTPYYGAW